MAEDQLTIAQWEERLAIAGKQADEWALMFKKSGFHPVLPSSDDVVRQRARGMLILLVTGDSMSAPVPPEVEPALERYTTWVVNRLGSSNLCLPPYLRREVSLATIVTEGMEPDFRTRFPQLYRPANPANWTYFVASTPGTLGRRILTWLRAAPDFLRIGPGHAKN